MNFNQLQNAVQPLLEKCPGCGSFGFLRRKYHIGRVPSKSETVIICCMKASCLLGTKASAEITPPFHVYQVQDLINIWNDRKPKPPITIPFIDKRKKVKP